MSMILARLRRYGGLAEPVPSALHLIAAIIERAYNTPDLDAMVPGGVFVGSGDRDTAVPYISLLPVGGESHWNNGPQEWFWVGELIRVRIFASSYHEFRQVELKWRQAFRRGMSPLLMADARHGLIVCDQPVYVGEDMEQGRPLHHGYVNMRAITNRWIA